MMTTKGLLGIFSLACFVITTAAFTLPERPPAHVNDYAKVLSKTALDGLEAKFTAFEQRTGHQAAVAIFPTIEGESVEDVTTKLFEKWRLGQAKQNDGILLVLALKERDVRIEVGYGLEAQLPDALAGRIITYDMVPFLKQDQVATAILAFEKRLEDIFIDGKTPAPGKSKQANPLTVILLVLFFLFLIRKFSSAQSQHTINSRGVSRRSAWWLGGGGLGGWGAGGGGWGGGWGGGGGGLSGGGGASGKW